MHVISKRALVDFWTLHPTARGPMSKWFRIVEHAAFVNFADVKATFNSADKVGDHVVFNVNAYRIVTVIHGNPGKLYIRHVFTHGEYDRWSDERRAGN